MKKLDGVFDSMTEFSHLYQSFLSAAKGKRFRSTVASYKMNLEERLFSLQEQLKNETYEFGPYRGFWVEEPKLRYIESAHFENRIVHHAIHSRIEPWFDPSFYEHSYACRTGRGSHRAMQTLRNWTLNRQMKWYLKCDVKKFFPSINREVLISILENKIIDEKLLRLLRLLITTAPNENGIPIGNLTSQLLANIYMNELDQFIKRTMQAKYYVRYMDDFIVLTTSKEEALQFFLKINKFITEKLKMQLSSHKTKVAKISEGISFVGYRIKNGKIRLRAKALRGIKKKVWIAFYKSHLSVPLDLKLDRVRHSKFFASYSSFLGQIKKTHYARTLDKKLLLEINSS